MGDEGSKEGEKEDSFIHPLVIHLTYIYWVYHESTTSGDFFCSFKISSQDRERQILYNLTYMRNLKKKAKFIEDDLVTRGGAREWGDWKEHQRYKISVIRKIISGDVT